MKDQIEWTAAGREELARLRRGPVLRLDDLPMERLHVLTARAVERFAPAWQLGLARTDDTGRAAIAFAATGLAGGALPTDATPEQAAWAMSLLSPIGDMTGPLAEQIMKRGAAFAIGALVAATALRVETERVPGAVTEDRQAISIRAIGDDERDRRMTGAHKLAAYLARVMRGTNAARSAGLQREATAAWASASTDTRLLLVGVTDDAVRAEELARALLPTASPYDGDRFGELAYLLKDVRLVAALRERHGVHLDLRILDNLGGAALPLYERAIAAKRPNDATSLLLDLCNVRGPRTARIFGRYAELRPNMVLVNNYFADSPALLRGLRRVKSMAPHRERLVKLEQKLGVRP